MEDETLRELLCLLVREKGTVAFDEYDDSDDAEPERSEDPVAVRERGFRTLEKLGFVVIGWHDRSMCPTATITDAGRERWKQCGGYDPLVSSLADYFADDGGLVDVDDGDCLLVDIELSRDAASWCSPERALTIALHDDRVWAMMLAARSKIEMARVAAKDLR